MIKTKLIINYLYHITLLKTRIYRQKIVANKGTSKKLDTQVWRRRVRNPQHASEFPQWGHRTNDRKEGDPSSKERTGLRRLRLYQIQPPPISRRLSLPRQAKQIKLRCFWLVVDDMTEVFLLTFPFTKSVPITSLL